MMDNFFKVIKYAFSGKDLFFFCRSTVRSCDYMVSFGEIRCY